MRAAIERHAEALRIGDAAAADMIGGFDHHIAPAGGGEPARGGDAGGAGADDDDLDRARTRRASRRRSPGRAASAAEAARNERRLNCSGLPGMVSKTLTIRRRLPELRRASKRYGLISVNDAGEV